MQSLQRAHPRHLAVTAAAAALLLAMSGRAVAQSASPAPSDQPSQSAGIGAEPARQTALAIAGATAMRAPPAAARPSPGQASAGGREMTADQRREFMMLLILHETSRNPIGSLR